jgi:S-adenosyl methyltransferase
MLDYWLRGRSHLRADRTGAIEIAGRFPHIPGLAVAAHEFRLRAARIAASEGTTRFIRAGMATWLPGRNVHDTVREIAPGARVIYVNRDDDAHELAAGLLAAVPGVEAVQARSRVPGEVLKTAPVAEMLAEGEPVALLLGGVLSFAGDAEAEAAVRAYAEALPPGSLLAFTVTELDGSPASRELAALYDAAPLHSHSPQAVARWTEGLDLLPPGAGDVRSLAGGDSTVLFPCAAPSRVIGAVARIP